jgi:SpoVK/Ycf46/Vps4 family AAA+-type ATPase
MLAEYLKAGYPGFCLLTQEPYRAEKMLVSEGWTFRIWDCLTGIRGAESNQIVEEIRDPVEAIRWLCMNRDTVLITHNLHLFLDIPEVIQAIQNGIPIWKGTGSAMVIVSPTIQLKPEVEKLFTIIDLPLPDDETLYELQTDLCKSVNINPNKRAAKAAKGLTEFEAETAFALSLIRKGYCSTRVVAEAKSQAIRRSGLMEFWEPANITDVGGLDQLKAFISNRAKAYELGNEHLPKPKGVLLVGIPGTGKSLSCKAAASIMRWPLIKLDIGNLKGSLVGESERKIRQATAVIDAFGEAVVWIDEVEKAFSGTRSSGETDAGTTANMFAHFLTWRAESKSSIIVMATANDIKNLPPEFLRAGRFDATFFVDLPTLSERIEIIKIMNRKYNADIPVNYAQKLEGWSGAEIEQLAKDSLYDGVEGAYKAIVPLSKTMKEDIQALKDWAKTRARLANTPDEEVKPQRKIHQIKKEAA